MSKFKALQINIEFEKLKPKSRYIESRVTVSISYARQRQKGVQVARAEGLDLLEGHITITIDNIDELRKKVKKNGKSYFCKLEEPYNLAKAITIKSIIGCVRTKHTADISEIADACVDSIAGLGQELSRALCPAAIPSMPGRDSGFPIVARTIRFREKCIWKWGRRK